MALRVTFGSISPGVGTVMRRLSVFNARTLVPLASPTAGQLARIWASSATAARATGSVATAPSSPTTMKETVDRIKASATESDPRRSEEHTSELQSQSNLVCRLLLEKKTNIQR